MSRALHLHKPSIDARPASRMPSQDVANWKLIVRVFLPFAFGYYLSYLFRTINALISPALIADFGLRPAELGFLTSAYFLAFGLIQLPLGVMLDRYGPRRVQSAFLIAAALGAGVFATAQSLTGLLAGRALIGLGVAGALMAGLKAITLWFPKDRIALANGWFVMLGALGAVTATTPIELLLAGMGWRSVFAILTGLTVLSAAAIFIAVPERPTTANATTTASAVGIKTIFADPRFWRLAPLSATTIGTAWALQGLWAAPWLTDVDGFDRPVVVRHLLVMAIALSAGALLFGLCADRLRRRRVPPQTLLAMASGLAIAAQIALVLRFPLSSYLLWGVIGAVGAVTVLSFAIVTGLFPPEATGRANGALNLLHVGYAFFVQSAVGVVVQFWPGDHGHYPAIAYQTAFAVNLAIQTGALLWFVRPSPAKHTMLLAAHPIHRPSNRSTDQPDNAAHASLAYRHAAKDWAFQLRAAHLQVQTWRIAAAGMLLIMVLLSALLMSATLDAQARPYLIEMEAGQ